MHKILGKNFTFDVEKYKKYSPMFLAPTFALNYGLGFAALMSSLVHVAIYDSKDILRQMWHAKAEKLDIHARLMSRYRETPAWWYAVLFVVSTAVGLGSCLGYDSQLPCVFRLVLGHHWEWMLTNESRVGLLCLSHHCRSFHSMISPPLLPDRRHVHHLCSHKHCSLYVASWFLFGIMVAYFSENVSYQCAVSLSSRLHDTRAADCQYGLQGVQHHCSWTSVC